MIVAYLGEHASTALIHRIEAAQAQFAALCAKLDTLSPLRVLTRGYTAVFDGEGSPITSGRALQRGDQICVRFEDATVDATVCGVRESE